MTPPPPAPGFASTLLHALIATLTALLRLLPRRRRADEHLLRQIAALSAMFDRYRAGLPIAPAPDSVAPLPPARPRQSYVLRHAARLDGQRPLPPPASSTGPPAPEAKAAAEPAENRGLIITFKQ